MSGGKARWFVGGQGGIALCQLAQTVVLARLLTPADFGVGAICYALTVAAQVGWDFGSAAAIMHRRDVTPNQLSSLYLVNLSLGAVGALLIVLLAPQVALLIERPDATLALAWISVAAMLGAMGGQFRALHQKELLFRRIVTIELGAAVASLCVSIAAAAHGAGFYAFVVGAIVSTALASTGFIFSGLRLHRPRLVWDLRGIREFLRFGSYQTGTTAINFVYTQLDIALVGAMLGASDLGKYAVAKQLCLRPIEIINPMLLRAAVPVMARLQSDAAALRAYFLDVLRVLNAVNFPIFVAIIVAAEPLVDLLFGAQWRSVAVVMQLLSGACLIRSFGNPTGSLLVATGHVTRAFKWDLAMLCILPPFLLVGSQYGLGGTATAMFSMYACIVVPLWYFLVRPASGARFSEWLGTFSNPLLCAATAGLLAYFACRRIAGSVAELVAVAGCGLAAYVVLSLRFNKRAIAAAQLLW